MNDPWVITLLLSAVPLLAVAVLRHPTPFLVATFALTPFQQALLGDDSVVKLGVVDLVAALLCLPLLVQVVRGRVLRLGYTALPVMLFLVLSVVSSLNDDSPAEAAVSIARMLMGTLVAIVLFANLTERAGTANACYFGFLVATNLLAVLIGLAFLQGGYQASMYAAGLNKNFIGPIEGCGMTVALVYLTRTDPKGWRRVWLLASVVGNTAGLVLSLSRGSWVATAVGILLVVAATRNYRLLLFGVVGVIAVAVAAWQLLPEDATAYASDVSLEAGTIQSRLDTWPTIVRCFEQSPFIGVGVSLRKWVEPHNVLVLTLGELGIVGVVLFLVMIGSAGYTLLTAFRCTADRPRLQTVVLAAAAVFAISVVHGMMDVYWRRGVGFMSWAGVGLAVYMTATAATRTAAGATTARVGRAMAGTA